MGSPLAKMLARGWGWRLARPVPGPAFPRGLPSLLGMRRGPSWGPFRFPGHSSQPGAKVSASGQATSAIARGRFLSLSQMGKFTFLFDTDYFGL